MLRAGIFRHIGQRSGPWQHRAGGVAATTGARVSPSPLVAPLASTMPTRRPADCPDRGLSHMPTRASAASSPAWLPCDLGLARLTSPRSTVASLVAAAPRRDYAAIVDPPKPPPSATTAPVAAPAAGPTTTNNNNNNNNAVPPATMPDWGAEFDTPVRANFDRLTIAGPMPLEPVPSVIPPSPLSVRRQLFGSLTEQLFSRTGSASATINGGVGVGGSVATGAGVGGSSASAAGGTGIASSAGAHGAGALAKSPPSSRYLGEADLDALLSSIRERYLVLPRIRPRVGPITQDFVWGILSWLLLILAVSFVTFTTPVVGFFFTIANYLPFRDLLYAQVARLFSYSLGYDVSLNGPIVTMRGSIDGDGAKKGKLLSGLALAEAPGSGLPGSSAATSNKRGVFLSFSNVRLSRLFEELNHVPETGEPAGPALRVLQAREAGSSAALGAACVCEPRLPHSTQAETGLNLPCPRCGQELLHDQQLAAIDTNVTQFDVTCDKMEVRLSFSRFMKGQGLVEDITIRGVRGTVDQRHLYWPPDYVNPPLKDGFDIRRVQVEDVLLTLLQPSFRPFNVSILALDLDRLRFRWFLYDILRANIAIGSYDDCLFTLHTAQRGSAEHQALELAAAGDTDADATRPRRFRSRHFTANPDTGGPDAAGSNNAGPLHRGSPLMDTLYPNGHPAYTPYLHLTTSSEAGNSAANASGQGSGSAATPAMSPAAALAAAASRIFTGAGADPDPKDTPPRLAHLKIVGVPFEHFGKNSPSGPMSWIYSGTVDISATLVLPEVDPSLLTPYYETYDPVQLRHFALHGEPPSEEAATYATGAGEPQLHPSVPIPYPPAAPAPHHAHPHPPMLIESNLRFNNLRAAVPLREGDWSYVDTTSLRPMVSYINAHATFLPLAYRLALPVSQFDSAWSLFDRFIAYRISDAIYNSFLRRMSDEQRRQRQVKRIGVWALREGMKGVANFWSLVRGLPYSLPAGQGQQTLKINSSPRTGPAPAPTPLTRHDPLDTAHLAPN
ncbi:hypothetical protein H696_02162 [Fonticula alba]|uniref:Uncharacterized protein n=1 Tax=Fonticula alba TaxID=691883 RepID=A0A058ZBA2_FONAL|nr:hypothetical protein H696_02162 [Fonticula alba]KCV71211.1 hypothetical protein H696_02162 [Fonticula alba]|eukprot:XP_009494334.1 hypothetical protein H696_02162 [Fonticula alba]